ncbi:MAG TPA: FtsX-like permease family protein [Acidimicrobiia bacterium]|nr:FtsX-like permease family protein [Acidimicrobiia bacterium]
MTSVQTAPRSSEVAEDGGRPARRAVIRWAWRLFRRQWRGQALVLALLTVAVAAAVGGSTAAYNLARAEGDAEFGAANHALEFEEPDFDALATDLVAAQEWFGTIDVISRRYHAVPGLFEPVELRTQDPDGPFSSPMLALVEGRYPTSDGEMTVTDGVAEIFDVGSADQVVFEGDPWTIVGLVENPSDLNDEFALVGPAQSETPESVTVLVAGSDDRLQTFRAPSGASAIAVSRPGNEDVLAAIGVLLVGTVVLLLVSLIAAAGFVVVAQRRLRQLGMLAAIGATERHLRLVMVANGAVIGAIAAIVGTSLPILGWGLVVPYLEQAVGHRIDRFDVPWWLIGASMLLAVVAATAAAWWPARTVARIPTVSALSGRPPRPQPTRRSAVLAGPGLTAGVACLVLAGDPLDGWINVALLVVGTVALILGVLSISPLAIRALAGMRRRSSVAVRLALRDLARYQARSGAALAAISLAVAIAIAIVIATSAALYATAAEGNLSDSQLMVRIGETPGRDLLNPIPELAPAELDQLGTVVDGIVAGLDRATVTPIDVAVARDFEGFGGLPAVVLTEEVEPGLNRILTFLYIASPAILEHYEVDLETIPADTEVLTVETDELWFEPIGPELVTNSEQLDRGYTSLPGSFITPSALRQRGWETGRAAWLIESVTPITEDQLAEAQRMAVNAGITVEARSGQANLVALRTGATAVGVLVALGILAMTVGLIRSEAQGDLHILTATGATSSIRRSLTAATAGSLALLGALLGTAGAYVGFAAGYADDLATLLPLPLFHLLVVVIGLPVVATVAGWLVAGREPATLARRPIE